MCILDLLSGITSELNENHHEVDIIMYNRNKVHSLKLIITMKLIITPPHPGLQNTVLNVQDCHMILLIIFEENQKNPKLFIKCDGLNVEVQQVDSSDSKNDVSIGISLELSAQRQTLSEFKILTSHSRL